jgi:hypothetical protein
MFALFNTAVLLFLFDSKYAFFIESLSNSISAFFMFVRITSLLFNLIIE